MASLLIGKLCSNVAQILKYATQIVNLQLVRAGLAAAAFSSLEGSSNCRHQTRKQIAQGAPLSPSPVQPSIACEWHTSLGPAFLY